LGEDRPGGVVYRGEQVDLRAGVVAAAARGLAVDRDRAPPARPGACGCWSASHRPMTWSSVQRVGVDAGRHAAHGGLTGWPPDPTQRARHTPSAARTGPGASAAHSPIAARDLAPGQSGGDRDGQHRAQRVPSAASLAWVGDLGEGAEQVTALGGSQRDGRVQLLRGRGDAR
jgi:hypothetical protein